MTSLLRHVSAVLIRVEFSRYVDSPTVEQSVDQPLKLDELELTRHGPVGDVV